MLLQFQIFTFGEFLTELAFHDGWQNGKADGRLNSTEVLSTLYKNVANFGSLTQEFTVMVWRPFMRQMHEIVETHSILETSIRQRMAGIAEQMCTKFIQKTCLVLHSDEFANNIAQEAGTPIRSLQRGVFACLRRDVCAGPGGLLIGSATHF